MKECRYGVALEGGGSRGAYQVGALKALIEEGFCFNAIAGTSIGAINAAIFCTGGIDYLEKFWNEIDSSIFDINPQISEKILNGNIYLKHKLIIEIIRKKGLSLNKLRNVLKKYIDEEKIRVCPIKYGLVITKLSGMEALEYTIDDIPKGKLIDYIIASSSLPIFKIEKNIDNNFYIDGAFKNVLPLTLIEKMNCKNIIGIRLKKFGIIRKVKSKDTNVVLIEPSKNTGSTLFFNKQTIKKNISLGYFDTKKMIAKIIK